MFSYYGSKSKVVDLYPSPKFGKIIEPFAGSARYSLKYFDREVILVDKYEKLISIWLWLQKCSPSDILKLPAMKAGENTDNFNFDCPEAKWFMGFIIQGGVNAPRKTVSSVGNFGQAVETEKKRIASELHKIKHWKIMVGSYDDVIDSHCLCSFLRPTAYALRTADNASRLALSLPVPSLSSVGSVDTNSDTISASWSGGVVIGTPSLPRDR